MNQKGNRIGRGAIIESSVSDLNPEDFRPQLIAHRGLRALVGGPPCESFSSLGKQNGRNDERGKQVFVFADWAAKLPFDLFILENVPGLLSIEQGRVFSDLLENFRTSGFAVSHRVLCAADYGAATIRKRLFIVGVRKLPTFIFPAATHSEHKAHNFSSNLHPWVSSREALDGLPPATKEGLVPQWHRLIIHTPEVAARFKALPPGAVDRVRKRNRLHPDRPAPGLYAGNMRGVRSHIHPFEPRELTNREAARLQGFPDDYVFNGNRIAVGKQIANAVPIKLARALAVSIVDQYAATAVEADVA
jgi:DNA (cytosine-5)-methyltransferase 1